MCHANWNWWQRSRVGFTTCCCTIYLILKCVNKLQNVGKLHIKYEINCSMTDILSLLDIVKLILTFVFLAKINPTRCFFSESKLKRTPSAYKTVGRKFFFFSFTKGRWSEKRNYFCSTLWRRNPSLYLAFVFKILFRFITRMDVPGEDLESSRPKVHTIKRTGDRQGVYQLSSLCLTRCNNHGLL